MKQTKIIMGTPITIEVVDAGVPQTVFDEVFAYFEYIDTTFSTYKNDSEITKLNEGKVKMEDVSDDMKLVLKLSEETKQLTNGYFDITTLNGTYDPSGLVKGWSNYNAAKILRKHNVKNFYIETGGDIQVSGHNSKDEQWSIGIQNPFSTKKGNCKTIYLNENGVATSGNYVRGQHIYDPVHKNHHIDDVVSITVIGPDVFEADRYATAAFAMNKAGINFIEKLPNFEGYSIDKNGIATMTSGFNNYLDKTYA